MWKRVHEAYEQDEVVDLGVAIEMTDILEPARAKEVFTAARNEPGWCALLVGEETETTPGNFDAAERVKEWLARYEETESEPFGELPDIDGIEAALAKLGDVAGRDPLTVLHRIDGELIMAIESEDDFELDDDMLLLDDPRVAYEAELAAREERRKQARSAGSFGLVLDSGALRPYDVASAIELTTIGRSRVVRIATTPARALMYLGFGGWNDCPNPYAQARVWEHWGRTIGAQPTVLGPATLEGVIARPISTRDALVQHAREAAAYDRDTVMEGWLPLLSMLWRSSTLHFWWD